MHANPALLLSAISGVVLLASCSTTMLAPDAEQRSKEAQKTSGWRCGGPPQSFVTAICIDPANPDMLVLGMDDTGGLYRSDDGGETVVQTLGDFAGINFGVSPDGQTIYAGDYHNNGLRRSRDGGRSWEARDVGPPESPTIADVWLSPADADVILVVTMADSFRGPKRAGGVWKSSDGGVTWERFGLEGKNGYSVAVPGEKTDTVYVGTYGDGVWCTRDGGLTWGRIGVEGKLVPDIDIDPRDPKVLLAAGINGGIYRSEDAGVTWSKTTVDGQDMCPYRFARSHTEPDVIYAGTLGRYVEALNPTPYGGILKSTDGGKSWSNSGLDGFVTISVAVDPTDSRRAFAGTYGGAFYRTADGGTTWQPLRAGFRDSYITSRAYVDAGNPNRVYVGTHATGPHCILWKSDDGGETWRETGAKGLGWFVVSGSAVLQVKSEQEDVLLLGAKLEGQVEAPGLMRSLDDGATWTKVLDAGVLNLREAPSGGIYAATFKKGIYRSRDAGATWTPAGLDGKAVTALWFDPRKPRRILAGGALGEAGSWMTDDGAESWQAATLPQDASVLALAGDPQSAARVFAGTTKGLFLSEDAGDSWTLLYDFKSAVNGVAVDPTGAGRIYVANFGGAAGEAKTGVWRSRDGGQTWERISEGLVTQQFGNTSGDSLVLAADGSLWAATIANGLWRWRE